MAKSDRRKSLSARKTHRKSAVYLAGGGASRYAQKKAAQRNGNFSPLSPFELGNPPTLPVMIERPQRAPGHFLDRPRAVQPLRPEAPPGLARSTRPAVQYQRRAA